MFLNSKHEARNSKQIQMIEIQMTKTKKLPRTGVLVLNFENLNFGFVSDFDIRISDLLFLSVN
jgi:hypothetical protein